MNIRYTDEVPSPDQIYCLYDCFGWNEFLKLSKVQLHQAMVQSWSVISAYDEDALIGTGRIISDGVMNAYLCGLVVHPDYQGQGIGSEIVRQLVEKSRQKNLHVELFCTEELTNYYEKLGFDVFAAGMKDKRRDV
nr:GNAT family N-acetyltransferase [Paenibacillus sp. OSY-SE]